MAIALLRRLFQPLPDQFDLDLAGGLSLHVSELGPAHAERLLAGYQMLSDRSRRLRFFGQLGSLSSQQVDFLTRPDGRNHLAYAAMDRSHPELPGVGVARCIRLDPDSAIAEVAITVLDAYQRRGVGTALHACLHVAGRAAGLEQFLFDVAAENAPYIDHLQALGAELVSRDDHAARLRLPVMASAKAVTADAAAAERFRDVLKRLDAVTEARPLAA